MTMSLRTNVADGTDLTDQLLQGCDAIIERLSTHCGYNASHAAIARMAGGDTLYEFTKDGISIVTALRFTPGHLGETVRLFAKHIGERVDTACHDGTTTAMLLFALLARQLVWRQSELPAAPRQRERALRQLLVDLTQTIRRVTLTPQELATRLNLPLTQVRYALAYQQALIASKGDHELAAAIAEVLAAQAIELNGQYVIHRAPVEREERVRVIRQDADFVFRGHANPQDFNHAMHTEYRSDDCDLWMTDNLLIAESPETRALLRWVQSEPALERDVVIVCEREVDSRLQQAINVHNLSHTKKIVVMTVYSNAGGHPTRAATAVYLTQMKGARFSGGLVLDFDGPVDPFIRNVCVRYQAGRVHIGRLYERDGEALHPYLRDPKANPVYTEHVDAMRTAIDNLTKKHLETKSAESVISHLISVYRQMTCQRILDIEVAGATHDNVANYSVAVDAYGAAVSALDHGVVFGGFDHLLRMLRHNDDRLSDMAYSAIAQVQAVVFGGEPLPTGKTGSLHLGHRMVDTSGQTVERTPRQVIATLKATDQAAAKPILVQPVVGFLELLKRLDELLPKLATTCCVINEGVVA